ncbi:SDR family NAD(P)-dependent oxidoreductase [Hyunsoonleella flava]|uniref:SDR family NAD(P)-dependent oxidoreductase n=1 Tax=Hyunsoonleella flava TaxID=2527939 RepID=A0A4Q9FIZ2_9FLAO|nr:UDP-N-acetylglucosamine 4,6-dehydratase [Hyunsoonleella flava]TBN06545.1 SDR family NAD(P)-dependent oxidoreductase [Hyunsoonleella flava]
MDNAVIERIKSLIKSSGLISEEKSLIGNSSTYDFSEEVILVTGAAGSIGSGLAKQLLYAKFKKVIFLDNAETPLFYLKKSISNNFQNNVEFVLGDIRDKVHMSHLFEMYKPTLIFHTAAYKHVSLVEENPYEAIQTNIFATQLLAQLALEYRSKRFIFISTDKAVSPVGVMGMAKAIAERFLSNLNVSSQSTRFISARFGNIFGSNGSVVPLFIKQIKKREAITITNKEATRLFIDMDEACTLILELAKLDVNGYNKVSFDMGKPIKIMDLAEVLISTFKAENKIAINITNLSSGEKLHEAITTTDEILVTSKHKKIFYLVKKSKRKMELDLEKLYKVNYKTTLQEMKKVLKGMC